MKWFYKIILPVVFLLHNNAHAQSEKDSLLASTFDTLKTKKKVLVPKQDNVTLSARDTAISISSSDTIIKPKHSPRIATFRSAVLPGWGQAYNKEAWKIPFVYTVIGIPAGFWIYNQTWYKRTKQAFEIRIDKDTARFGEIHSKLQGLGPETLRFYRNDFKKNKDYSVLYFLLAWGLNVADATVFAHLKDFDVSDDLGFQVKPGYSPLANTTGLSLVLAVKSPTRHSTYNFQ